MEHFCEHSKPLAVHCRQLTFGYKAKCPVIDGLSMSVPSASIYSLLGSSSAGKTTLLKLISATHQAQKGDIYLFGERLGDKRCSVPGKHVGYMPQDLCLYPKFSIKETLQYFARINDVKSDEIEKRIKYFKEYLELPSVDKPIHRLSGGQQRRVSLAAALIHSPALLLLDEPTVGIDPLLRYKIWNYFYNLRNKGQTLVITTHYIEETVHSDYVAFLRAGKLVCEHSPQALMRLHGASKLEDVLYLICHQLNVKKNMILELEGSSPDQASELPLMATLDEPHAGQETFEKQLAVTVRRQVTVMRRTWRLYLSETGSLFLLTVFPFLIACLYNLQFYKDPSNAPIGIVNHDSYFNNVSLPAELLHSISSGQLATLRNFESRRQMVESIERGHTMVGLYFGHNYTQCMFEKLEEGLRAENETIECSNIHSYADTTSAVKLWTFAMMFLTKFRDTLTSFAARMNLDSDSLRLPIKFLDMQNREVAMKFENDQYLMSGMITMLNFLQTILMSGLVWLKDHDHGIMLRSGVHRVTKNHFLVAHSVALSILSAAATVLLMVAVVPTFRVPLDCTLLYTTLVLALQAVSSMFIGLFIAVTSSNTFDFIIKSQFCIMPVFYCGENTYPLAGGGNLFTDAITTVYPLKAATVAFRALIFEHFDITDYKVFAGVLHMLLVSIAAFAFSMISFKIRK